MKEREIIRLWETSIPYSLGNEPKDIPTLEVFIPKKRRAKSAVVICPGGGYWILADHEGRDYALWLNSIGVTAFVLKYRLSSDGYHYPAMFEDIKRAVRLVRSKKKEFNHTFTGVMGSSAGGHLASLLLTYYDNGNPYKKDPIERESCRPDFGILCYPVISMDKEKGHSASCKNLLNDNPSDYLCNKLSTQKHVNKETPPCFIFHTVEDRGIPPEEHSMPFVEALIRNNVPVEFHLYQKGEHGMGLGKNGKNFHRWTYECFMWLKENGYI